MKQLKWNEVMGWFFFLALGPALHKISIKIDKEIGFLMSL